MVYEDESKLSPEEQKRDSLAALTVLIVTVLIVAAFAAGNYTGTKEASQHCAAEVRR